MPEYRKKLIEVALPLEAINKESAREKSIRHGHPSTLHLWWARRPLAACRAVLFAQMVDDPSSLSDEFPTEEAQETERQRLFRIIEDLVKWANTTNEALLQAARVEIARSAARNHGVSLPHSMTPAEVVGVLEQYAPPILDPFAGGGSIPLEAQRLGLEAYASDLNPVAVLINKALIEIPPKFSGRPPVNPESREKYLHKEWKGAEGLAEDVRYYGNWMRNEAWKRIGHLYPKVHLPKEYGSGETTVIAWLWAHTVTCPNPACMARMPLVHSFWLSTKKNKEAWVEPVVDRFEKTVRFEVRHGAGAPEGIVNRLGAKCIICGSVVPFDHIRTEGSAARMDAQMIAIVAEGKGERIYLPPNKEHENIAKRVQPEVWLDTDLPAEALGFRVQRYGLTKHGQLFTARQFTALDTFADLIGVVRAIIEALPNGSVEYANAVSTYLAFALDKAANYWSSLCSWHQSAEKLVSTFGLPVLSMVWDFTEANPLSESSGNWMLGVEQAAKGLDGAPASGVAYVSQTDAANRSGEQPHGVVSTDPPYYDNIGYVVM